jgi:hypothetical protein
MSASRIYSNLKSGGMQRTHGRKQLLVAIYRDIAGWNILSIRSWSVSLWSCFILRRPPLV